MGQVTITLNGRSYRLRCGDGEEARLLALAGHVESKLGSLAAEFGQVGDERLLVMTAIMITDELFDARQTCAELLQPGSSAGTDEGLAGTVAPQLPAAPDGAVAMVEPPPASARPQTSAMLPLDDDRPGDPPLQRAMRRTAREAQPYASSRREQR